MALYDSLTHLYSAVQTNTVWPNTYWVQLNRPVKRNGSVGNPKAVVDLRDTKTVSAHDMFSIKDFEKTVLEAFLAVEKDIRKIAAFNTDQLRLNFRFFNDKSFKMFLYGIELAHEYPDWEAENLPLLSSGLQRLTFLEASTEACWTSTTCKGARIVAPNGAQALYLQYALRDLGRKQTLNCFPKILPLMARLEPTPTTKSGLSALTVKGPA